MTPGSYSEFALSKKGSFETEEELLGEALTPEAYTEEQKKLLGCTNMSWTRCVDGYGKDGKRVYDPIEGRSCHQCRLVRLHCNAQNWHILASFFLNLFGGKLVYCTSSFIWQVHMLL